MSILVAILAARACMPAASDFVPPAAAPASAPLLAQVEASVPVPYPGTGWKHSIAVYFLAAGLDGQSTVHGVDADVDVGFSDIWDHLDAGLMLAYRAETERYAIQVDAIYMGLEGEKDTGPVTTRAEFDELVVELDGCFRVSPQTDVIVGARYWGLDADVELSGPGGTSADGSKEWVDPVVGARHTWSFDDAWSLTLRGDIGGFGVGSDFAWQALARLSWQFSSSTALAFGYRVVDVDYHDGSGADEFRYDVTTSGVLAGLIFGF